MERKMAMSDTWMERLSEYIDGTLPERERAALEEHVASCAECRTTLAELRRVVARAAALDDRPPTTNIWPGIAARIGVVSLDPRRARRRPTWSARSRGTAAGSTPRRCG